MKKENKGHLKYEERQYICVLHLEGQSLRRIAKKLGRHHSVIGKELKRNSSKSLWYAEARGLDRASYAHKQAKDRRSNSRKRRRLKSQEIRTRISDLIKKGLTPELAAGRLHLDRPDLRTNYNSIYKWIDEERNDLIKYLPVKGQKGRGKKIRKRQSKTKIAASPKTSIESRPKEANERQRIGDWEGDTIVSRQSKFCIFTLVDRLSRYCFLDRLSSCKSAEARASVVASLRFLPKNLRKTLTLDNGPENAGHASIDKDLETQTYFCHPYSAWERGSVENLNGYIRRFFPKKTDFASISLQQIIQVQDNHNNRPMKCLGFRTPKEVLYQSIQSSKEGKEVIAKLEKRHLVNIAST